MNCAPWGRTRCRRWSSGIHVLSGVLGSPVRRGRRPPLGREVGADVASRGGLQGVLAEAGAALVLSRRVAVLVEGAAAEGPGLVEVPQALEGVEGVEGPVEEGLVVRGDWVRGRLSATSLSSSSRLTTAW